MCRGLQGAQRSQALVFWVQNLGVLGDVGESRVPAVSCSSSITLAVPTIHLGTAPKPWLSANVFLMCLFCDRLGSESRLFSALCCSPDKFLLKIIPLLKAGLAFLLGRMHCDGHQHGSSIKPLMFVAHCRGPRLLSGGGGDRSLINV